MLKFLLLAMAGFGVFSFFWQLTEYGFSKPKGLVGYLIWVVTFGFMAHRQGMVDRLRRSKEFADEKEYVQSKIPSGMSLDIAMSILADKMEFESSQKEFSFRYGFVDAANFTGKTAAVQIYSKSKRVVSTNCYALENTRVPTK